MLSLGAANAVCVVGGLGIGWFVDRLAGTQPIFLFVGLVLGVAAGVMFSYSKLRRFLS